MKKQLGLLTLGMALCLVAPIVGRAAEPGSRIARVEVEGTVEEGGPKILEAPDIMFSKLRTGETSARSDSIGVLKVVNTNSNARWEVKVQAGKFSNGIPGNEFSHDDFLLEEGAVQEYTGNQHAEIPTISAANISDGGAVMSSEKGNVGQFWQTFGYAKVTVPEARMTGTYTAPVTWTVVNG